MARVQKIFFKTLLITLGFSAVLVLSIMAFIYLAPQFGAKPTGAHLEKIAQSNNYQDNQFVNLIKTGLDYSMANSWGTIKEYASAKNTSPSQEIPTRFGEQIPKPTDSTVQLTWYGHSAVLLQIKGKRIFLDPMLGPAASPVTFLFGKRFGNTPPLSMESLPYLDAVIFSHDHYDHLDYATVKAIKDKVGHFYTPLGLGAHLVRWGVSPDKITELDWWQSVDFEELKFIAAPARHFSGRGISDGNKTLWASWIVQSPEHNIYFSGDSGYGPHFAEIGAQYGPFDIAMMECGQYNTRWEQIHMMPEQTVQASIDLKARLIMPIHWGAFTLAPHAWYEPAERVAIAARSSNVELITPEVGESFTLSGDLPKNPWWTSMTQSRLSAIR